MGARHLAIDSTNIYWTDDDNGTFGKVPIAGGTIVTLATGQAQPWGIAVDGTKSIENG